MLIVATTNVGSLAIPNVFKAKERWNIPIDSINNAKKTLPMLKPFSLPFLLNECSLDQWLLDALQYYALKIIT
jgi:hypothetical protein